ncbi:unnamed protein product [Paramecium octaurelia]|uniref:Arrestin C-terminal-like domain-containing protein n=1 Tax=Paramecium octaurelia TaxID=43137 RepID=A0A8S1TWB3_PAROT|nr:unnamed protein product [Paramecium octaurelia]
MGNKQGSEFGGIMVRTEKTNYFAGDLVKGNIYLHIIKSGYHGNVVQFSIVGKEKTEWEVSTGKSSTTHRGKNVFYEDSFVINTFLNENLMVGQFVFPFELELPLDLPGSLYHSYGLLASVAYKIKVRIISNSKSINDIKNEQEIIIREPIQEILQASQKKVTANLTTWCCKQQGFCSITAKAEKNLYQSGELVNITYDIDNSNCKLNLEKVDASIMSRLIIQSNSGAQYRQEVKLNSVSQSGIQKGMKLLSSASTGCSLQLVNIKNPTIVLAPSTNGSLVNFQYYVIINPNFEGCTFCSSKPIVEVPITLFTLLPQEDQEPIAQPENWQPKAFQPFLIKSNSINPFNKNSLKKMANPMNS